jgi:hypothetical protein
MGVKHKKNTTNPITKPPGPPTQNTRGVSPNEKCDVVPTTIRTCPTPRVMWEYLPDATKHQQEEEKDMSQVPFVIGVGILMYAMVYTRPYIAHAVGALSSYMSKPGKEH